jgi:hypothetical protein
LRREEEVEDTSDGGG